ncbi:MAG: exodeoxyribonuclease VII large subunit, partial [Thiohalobacteraceae bacterium]
TFTRLQERLNWLDKRLQQQHPGQRLRQRAQRLDELEQRLLRAVRAGQREHRAQLATLAARLQRHHPGPRLQQLRDRENALALRLQTATRTQLQRLRQRLRGTLRALDAVSPLATLERGYAIVTTDDGRVLQNAGRVQRGDKIHARLAHGRLRCTVDDAESEG